MPLTALPRGLGTGTRRVVGAQAHRGPVQSPPSPLPCTNGPVQAGSSEEVGDSPPSSSSRALAASRTGLLIPGPRAEQPAARAPSQSPSTPAPRRPAHRSLLCRQILGHVALQWMPPRRPLDLNRWADADGIWKLLGARSWGEGRQGRGASSRAELPAPGAAWAEGLRDI